MKNWKTSVTGILAILPTVLVTFGVPIPAAVVDSFKTFGLAQLGWLAADAAK